MKYGVIYYILFYCCISNALVINWYDSNGDKDKTILEVSCNNKTFNVVIEKKDLKKETEIINIVESLMKGKCYE